VCRFLHFVLCENAEAFVGKVAVLKLRLPPCISQKLVESMLPGEGVLSLFHIQTIMGLEGRLREFTGIMMFRHFHDNDRFLLGGGDSSKKHTTVLELHRENHSLR